MLKQGDGQGGFVQIANFANYRRHELTSGEQVIALD